MPRNGYFDDTGKGAAGFIVKSAELDHERNVHNAYTTDHYYYNSFHAPHPTLIPAVMLLRKVTVYGWRKTVKANLSVR